MLEGIQKSNVVGSEFDTAQEKRPTRIFKFGRESIELGLIYAKKKKKVLPLPLSITPPSKKFTNYIEKVHHGFTILYFSVENFKLWAPYQIKKPISMRRTKVGRI